MKKLLLSIVVIALLTGVVLHAGKKNIEFDKLPENIKSAFQELQASIGKAHNLNVSTEEVDGMIQYELEFNIEDDNIEVVYDKDGKILEYNEEIDYKELPSAAIKSLKKEFPGFIIKKVQKVMKNGGLDCFEAKLLYKEKKYEVRIKPEGKILSKEKDED